MCVKSKKFTAGVLLIALISVFATPESNCMNDAKHPSFCETAVPSSAAVKVVNVLELRSSFVSNIVRTACEYSPAVVGARAIYEPLTGWMETRPARILSNAFLIFPTVGAFCPRLELAFNWLGAVPALASCALMLGDGLFVILAKCGCYKDEWKVNAKNKLDNEGQTESTDWVNNLP